jgi:SMC interacting uncharacterized protein involved in chromosome segregation
MSVEEWECIWRAIEKLEKEVELLKNEVQEIKTYLENIDIKIYDFKDEV